MSQELPILTCCEPALEWILQNIPPKKLVEQLNTSKEAYKALSQGGFSIQEANIGKPLFQTRLQVHARKNATFQLLLIGGFTSDPICKAIEKIIYFKGEEAVEHSWRELYDLIPDKPHFVLTLANWKEETRLATLGRRLLKCPSLWKKALQMNSEEAKEWYRRHFENDTWEAFTYLLGDMASHMEIEEENHSPAPEKGKARAGKEEKLTEKYQALQNERNAIRSELNEKKKLVQSLQEQLGTAQHDLKKAQHNHQTELERQRVHAELKLQEALRHERNHLLGIDENWCQQATLLSDQTEDLLQHAKQVLEEQKRRNLLYGTKSALRQKAAELDMTIAALQDAADEALNLHPEALKLLQKLELVRAEVLSHCGDHNTAHTVIFEHIETAIKSLPLDKSLPASLKRFTTLQAQAQSLGLLSDSENEQLHDIAEQRHRLLVSATVENTIRPPEPHDTPRIPEIWNIATREELPRVTIFLDGFNVILRSKYWQDQLHGRQENFQEVRHQFNLKCAAVSPRFLKMKIVYDGNSLGTTIESFNPKLDIIFARKVQEEHNADLYIIDRMLNDKQPGDIFWLVTDDIDLRKKAAPATDAVIPSQDFNRFIGATRL
ncbi:MAG: hypothetical protein IJJ26_08240 [Victivallales bacterium]|nr:hypothetical protein [Victivallales bacterium]